MDDEEIKSEIRDAWSQDSQYYDTHISHKMSSDTEKNLWKNLFASVIPKGENLRVLDVGCGTGAAGLIFSEMNHTVNGIDLSKEMMEVGKKKAESLNLSMTFDVGDAENPQFEDSIFDVIINRHLLWTLPNPEKAFSNWYRILKPSGVLIVIDGIWNDDSMIHNLRKKISFKIASIAEEHPHGKSTHYSDELSSNLPNMGGLSKEKTAFYFKNAGFEDISVIELDSIIKEQRKNMKWYQKIAPKNNYFLISGVKKDKCITRSNESKSGDEYK